MWPKGIANIADRRDELNSGMGLALPGWVRTCTLYLPDAPTDFRLWHADGRTQRYGDFLLRETVDPERGTTRASFCSCRRTGIDRLATRLMVRGFSSRFPPDGLTTLGQTRKDSPLTDEPAARHHAL